MFEETLIQWTLLFSLHQDETSKATYLQVFVKATPKVLQPLQLFHKQTSFFCLFYLDLDLESFDSWKLIPNCTAYMHAAQ